MTDRKEDSPIKPERQHVDAVDHEALVTLRSLQVNGEPDFLTSLIDLYLSESSRHLETLRIHLQNQQGDDLRRVSHLWRGATVNVGGTVLASRLGDLEKQVAVGDFQAAKSTFQEVEGEFARVRQALLAERQPLQTRQSKP